MKKFLLCIVLPFLVVSCSTESDFDNSATLNPSGVRLNSNSNIPQNRTNPFDTKGKKYFDILNIYLKNNKVPNSINEMTDQIQFLSRNYGKLSHTSSSTVSFTSEEVSLLMNEPKKQLIEIIENGSLSSEAKTDLLNFTQTLIERQGGKYEELYKFIVSYETVIIANTTLKEEEKEMILTVASISRYTLYAETEHKDRDWETSVANRKVEPVFNSDQASIISVIALVKMLV